MLTITVDRSRQWDQKNQVFFYTEPAVLHLEHSLRAISKWEALHEKPFLGREVKTAGEMLDYVRCMCLDDGVEPAVFQALTRKQLEAVRTYLDLPMTATWFSNHGNRRPPRGVITSELVYFWMCSFGIDWQAQDWHFNRLMTLIRVCSEKNKSPKKVPKGKAAAQQRALNASRRRKYHTRG